LLTNVIVTYAGKARQTFLLFHWERNGQPEEISWQ